jgi:hypothetical protein
LSLNTVLCAAIIFPDPKTIFIVSDKTFVRH